MAAAGVYRSRGSTFDARGATNRLRKTAAALKPTKILTEMGVIALGLTQATMKAEKDPITGRGWKPLKPATKRAKGHGKILYDSGALRRSLTRRGAGNVWRMSKNMLVIGTSLVQNVHQYANKKRGRPRRRYLGYGKAHHKIIIKPLLAAVRKAGQGRG